MAATVLGSWHEDAARRSVVAFVEHDGQREFASTSGAEQALDLAHEGGRTIVSMRNDWATIF